jgi:hypothetical protein
MPINGIKLSMKLKSNVMQKNQNTLTWSENVWVSKLEHNLWF